MRTKQDMIDEETCQPEIDQAVHAVMEAVEHVLPHVSEHARGDFFIQLCDKLNERWFDEQGEQQG